MGSQRKRAGHRVAQWLAALCCGVVCITAAVAEPVRIGLARTASSGPIYIAISSGYFASEGLEPQLTFFPSDALVTAALVSGKLDFGASSLDAEFFVFAKKHSLRTILAQEGDQPGYPGNALVVTQKAYDAGARDWKGLAGKRIGVPFATSGSRYALAQMFAKYSLEAPKVTPVRSQISDVLIAALMRGRIDAAMIPAAPAQQLVSQGKGKILRWIGDDMPWQEAVVVTRAETIAGRRAFVEKFVRAYQRASADYDLAFLQHDDGSDVIAGPHFDEYLGVIAKYTEIPPARLQRQLPWIDRLARINVTDVERQVQFWQGAGLVDKSISANDLLDLSFLPEHIGTTR
jgi:NitT/TauT family transport system substrate-binding protein